MHTGKSWKRGKTRKITNKIAITHNHNTINIEFFTDLSCISWPKNVSAYPSWAVRTILLFSHE
jgi:hypothetical protein